jgi:tetratricopeptide (TPR) repeat protein
MRTRTLGNASGSAEGMRSRGLAFCFAASASLSGARAKADAVARFPDASPPGAVAPPTLPEVSERGAGPPAPATEVGPARSGSEQLSERAARYLAAARITEAIGAYSESIRLDPKNGGALLALGRIRVQLGELGEAELLFSTAARLRSVASDALAERAHLRHGQGRDAEAIADLEHAVDLAPEDTARAEELSAWHVAHRAWLPALAVWRRAAAGAEGDGSIRRATVQVRALAVLAADLDVVRAGASADHSWTRRALARLGKAGVP